MYVMSCDKLISDPLCCLCCSKCVCRLIMAACLFSDWKILLQFCCIKFHVIYLRFKRQPRRSSSNNSHRWDWLSHSSLQLSRMLLLWAIRQIYLELTALKIYWLLLSLPGWWNSDQLYQTKYNWSERWTCFESTLLMPTADNSNLPQTIPLHSWKYH